MGNPAAGRPILKIQRARPNPCVMIHLKTIEKIFPEISGVKELEVFHLLNGSQINLSIKIDDAEYRLGDDRKEFVSMGSYEKEGHTFYRAFWTEDSKDRIFNEEWIDRLDEKN